MCVYCLEAHTRDNQYEKIVNEKCSKALSSESNKIWRRPISIQKYKTCKIKKPKVESIVAQSTTFTKLEATTKQYSREYSIFLSSNSWQVQEDVINYKQQR